MKKQAIVALGVMLVCASHIQAAIPTTQSKQMTEVVAYLAHPANNGDLYLMYDEKRIASISIYGAHPTAVGWDVNYRYPNCDDFSNIQSHLSVKSSAGNMKEVVRYTCTVR